MFSVSIEVIESYINSVLFMYIDLFRSRFNVEEYLYNSHHKLSMPFRKSISNIFFINSYPLPYARSSISFFPFYMPQAEMRSTDQRY